MRADIHPCRIADIEAAPALVAEYAHECGNAAIGDAVGQFATYRQLEEIGALRSIGAFVGKDLVGFVNVLVTELPHYGRRVATTESLFVAAQHRRSGAGLALLSAAERDAAARGAVALLVSTPADSTLEAVMAARGAYYRSNTVFCRSLT